MYNSAKSLAFIACLTLAGGCVVSHTQRGAALDPGTRWVVLPVLNFSETPQAGERVEAIVGTILRARGVSDLRQPPASVGDGTQSDLPEIDERRRRDRAIEWARGQGFVYGVSGSVEEWRYRAGLDGEPAVGVTVEVIEIASGRVVWSATGARSGWGRESVSGTAQKLVTSLVGELKLDAAAARDAMAQAARSGATSIAPSATHSAPVTPIAPIATPAPTGPGSMTPASSNSGSSSSEPSPAPAPASPLPAAPTPQTPPTNKDR